MIWRGRGIPSKPNALKRGSVVSAPIVPDYGIVKMRRSIVLHTNTPTQDNPSRCILVVGVTTDNDKYDPVDRTNYPPDLFIQMPHSEDGKCPSSFTSPCAAKANWVQRFVVTQLGPVVGYLDDALLDDLILKRKAYNKKLRN